jgi:hypothetical protein
MANPGGVGVPVPPADDGELAALVELRSEWDKALFKVTLDKFDGTDAKYDDMEFKVFNWLERRPDEIAQWMIQAGDHADTIVQANLNPRMKIASAGVYSLFADICVGDALDVVKSVPDRCGLEVYRLLRNEAKPKVATRSHGLMEGLLEFKREKGETVIAAMMRLEKGARTVDQARGFPVDRDMMLTLLTRLCPDDVR